MMITTVHDVDSFIPFCKGWLIRLGVLDLASGTSFLRDLLNRLRIPESHLSDDVRALIKASSQFVEPGADVEVGESGTLFRFLQFLSWTQRKDRKFIRSGTLASRKICVEPSIIDLSIQDLLMLDNGTSQWASAAILCRNDYDLSKISTIPAKLQLTIDAKEHWLKCAKGQGNLTLRVDDTIRDQAKAFFFPVATGKSVFFTPKHSEDYCFARAFGLMTSREGLDRWPSLIGHESNRIEEMEKALNQYRKGESVDSMDHRVVQAVAMLAAYEGQESIIAHPQCVSKSWPLFLDFLEAMKGIAAQ